MTYLQGLENKKKYFLIVALDLSDFDKAVRLIDELGNLVFFYKVGMQLYFSHGDKILNYLSKKNKKIFLDLKLNDIPQTLLNSIHVLSKKPIEYLTLFCNPSSIQFVKNNLHLENIRLLNVSLLTSDKVSKTRNKVWNRTKESLENGADGMICSGEETAYLRKKIKKNFILINPGIRLDKNNPNDQKRISTPLHAWESGASHIVVGRPITQSKNPIQSVNDIYASLPFTS